MRILITGGHGQLGRSLMRALSAHDIAALSHAELDVADARTVDAAFERHRPEAVVHSAALTDTMRCEREPGAARAINAIGSENVARACARNGARLVAVSTNEVFDGEKRTPYTEDDAPRAVNAYGASKLDGERLAGAVCPGTLVARTSWLYGDGGNNFIEKVRAAAAAGRKLSFVTDEIAAPTSTEDLAQAIRQLLEQDAPAGVYHLVNEGEASRYDWARAILRLSSMADVPVEAVTTAELRAGGYTGPRKPAYSVLANTRARRLGITLRPWQEALAAYFERARAAADG
jgi:dTDP-4-dehydrorhamnose reductase